MTCSSVHFVPSTCSLVNVGAVWRPDFNFTEITALHAPNAGGPLPPLGTAGVPNSLQVLGPDTGAPGGLGGRWTQIRAQAWPSYPAAPQTAGGRGAGISRLQGTFLPGGAFLGRRLSPQTPAWDSGRFPWSPRARQKQAPTLCSDLTPELLTVPAQGLQGGERGR